MTLRSAAAFAIIGTGLWTLVLALDLIRSLSGLAHGIVAMATVLTTLIHFVAALSLLVFFLVYHSKQS